MISREKFKRQLELAQSLDQITELLHDNGIEILESKLFNIPSELFSNFLYCVCTDDGADWVEWWLYEDVEKVVYEGDKEIRLDTIDDLYNYLKTNHYFIA